MYDVLTYYSVEAAVYNHTAAVQAGSDAETQGDEIFQLGATKKKFTTVEEECVAAVLMEADIIVTTCIGAGVSYELCKLSPYYLSYPYPYLFLIDSCRLFLRFFDANVILCLLYHSISASFDK